MSTDTSLMVEYMRERLSTTGPTRTTSAHLSRVHVPGAVAQFRPGGGGHDSGSGEHPARPADQYGQDRRGNGQAEQEPQREGASEVRGER
ncbi:hypothetical protein [Haloactinospora alba]|uniref:hypothetical protein n=1 Tax=Haloactinospora alba TaxID=405555 RepID=UPI0011500AA0|nr:hypothetical protein [Haloactinospora alba]